MANTAYDPAIEAMLKNAGTSVNDPVTWGELIQALQNSQVFGPPEGRASALQMIRHLANAVVEIERRKKNPA